MSSKDPVCGADVSEREAISKGYTAEFGGQIRFFCSEKCRDMFKKEPTRHWQPQAMGGESKGEPGPSHPAR